MPTERWVVVVGEGFLVEEDAFFVVVEDALLVVVEDRFLVEEGFVVEEDVLLVVVGLGVGFLVGLPGFIGLGRPPRRGGIKLVMG